MNKSPCNAHDLVWTPEEEEAFNALENVPDVEIEYQEDDGNSNCDGGSCVI